MITAVLIDIDNTLLDFEKCSEQAMRENFAAHSFHYSPEMFPVFTEINNSLWHKLEQGKLSLTGLHDIRWELIFSRLGLNADGREFEKGFLEQLSLSAVPVEGAEELLGYLSEKYSIYAATNGPFEQQCRRMGKANMSKYLSGLFVSEKAGHNKPSKGFFDYCFARMPGIKPENTALIGDSLTADITGGNEYGLKTIWLNRGEATENSPRRGCDYEIKSLTEITNIL